MAVERKQTNSIFNRVDDEETYISELRFNTYKLNWTIRNFEFTCKHVKCLQSPKFPAKNDKNEQWYIYLEPVELMEDTTFNFKIQLKRDNDKVRSVQADITIFASSREVTGFTTEYLSYDTSLAWLINGGELYKKLLNDNSLPNEITVTCRLNVFNEGVSSLQKQLIDTLHSDDLMGQIKNSISDETLKDVTFKVEEKKFTAHKFILSLRSPVFAAMFDNNMTEKLTSCVEIKDVRANIFQKMLRFIYTDHVEDLRESAVELYYAAEKYDLNNLKIMCVNNLSENLSCDNVVKTLELAELFSISRLRNISLQYLASNLEFMRGKKNLMELIKSHAHLAPELLNMFKSKNKNQDDEESVEEMILKLRILDEEYKDPSYYRELYEHGIEDDIDGW